MFFVRHYLAECAVGEQLQSDSLSAVAIWRGLVIGGGVGLTYWCQFKIATESASFSIPETNMPMGTDQAVACLLPTFDRANLPRALYISLACPQVKGLDVVRHGLATHFVKADDLGGLKAELGLFVRKDTSKGEIEAIIDKHATVKFHPSMVRDIANIDQINYIFQPDSVE